MFTGIIFHTQEYSFEDGILSFKTNSFWEGTEIGESIAVNGVCLTVISIDEYIRFFVCSETINLTNISNSTFANVEKSLTLGSKISGHLVSGHVQTTAVILDIIFNESGDQVLFFKVKEYPEKLKYKDSISINGTSLTIASVNGNQFSVCMIPHTWNNTVFQRCKIDDVVNIEFNENFVNNNKVEQLASCNLITKYGNWNLYSFSSTFSQNPHRVIHMNLTKNKPIVRIHSECFTGDVLFSKHCDCGNQLEWSMEEINKNGNGLIIFPPDHEGRGIGFTNKIKAYSLIQNNPEIDTYQANKQLGFEEDSRNYNDCKEIIKLLGIESFILLTSNPNKISSLKPLDFIVDYKTCGLCEINKDYLTIKAKKHGLFKLPESVDTNNKKICLLYTSDAADE